MSRSTMKPKPAPKKTNKVQVIVVTIVLGAILASSLLTTVSMF